MLETFRAARRRGIGVDLSSAMLAAARGRLEESGARNVQLRQGDIYALPVVRNSCDVAILHQVLHYLDDPAAPCARRRGARAGRTTDRRRFRATTKKRCVKNTPIAVLAFRRKRSPIFWRKPD